MPSDITEKQKTHINHEGSHEQKEKKWRAI